MASGSHGSSASPRSGIRRNNSLSAVHTLSSVNDVAPPKTSSSSRVPGRASMDSFDRAKFFRPSAADTIMSSSPPKPRSWHKKSSSSPSSLLSPPLGPQSLSLPGTPSLTSLASIPAVVVEDEVEPLDIRSSSLPQSYPSSSSTSMFFGRAAAGSAASTPAGTPPASPGLRAAATAAAMAAAANISASPSPSTTPPSSPSLSFLTTWQGRLPSIPRPSPMTPFRAARKVVTSVTAVGSGLLPSKEQLGSIPVAGRIINHPVMDSTLNYIASKTTHRKESKPISPEDIHYRKLNKKLVEQSITLASLAIEKEELSKTLDDEEGDDAFELYLAAISTLMHALPIETCDPLRREAFEAQLRGFLQDHEFDSADEDTNEKQRRRRRRHRHRRHHEQATHLIDQHILVLTDENAQTLPSVTPAPPRTGRGRGRGGRASQRRKGGRNNSSRIQSGSSIGDTIITTAVQSAIRLKQSPIPDVIKTCLRTSRAILSHVDERFHLQERAWQWSKQSIEKAIELDEQYAIHEVVAETFFATVTGLVKAGIAYKETPGYTSLKALTGPPHPLSDPSTQGALVLRPPDRPNHPQAIKESPWGNIVDKRRRYSIIAEEEEEYVFKQERHGRVSDDEEPGNLSSSSSSCFTTSEEESIYDNEEVSVVESSGRDLFAVATGSLPEDYSERVRQKVGLFVALKTAASMILGSQA